MDDMKIDDILRNCVEDLTKALNESRGKIERLEVENASLRKQLKSYYVPMKVFYISGGDEVVR
jgi:uncharacterized protein (UPF0335 family)